MLVVVDTNVFISGIFWPGPSSKILELWVKGVIRLLVSEDILTEYIRVIDEMASERNQSALGNKWSTFIVQNAIILEAPAISDDCRDPDDNKFIDCAVAGQARYLISGDKALLELKKVFEIPVMTPSNFLKHLSG